MAQFSYQPPYKPNQVICGSGPTVVVTGWTVKESLVKYLLPREYAAIGNLYSPTRGISPLIRNLLANPQVSYLVILNATPEDSNAGSPQCLLDFFRHGFTLGTGETGRECWVIRSSIIGYIDREIDGRALEQLRKSLQWQEAKSIPEAVSLVKSYTLKDPPPPRKGPLIFPEREITVTTGHSHFPSPGPTYGHRIEGKTIAITWVKILHRIRTIGTIRPTAYDSKWQELIDLMAIITEEPEDFYFPEPNYLPIGRQFLGAYISQMLDDTPQEEGVKYTYGTRLRSWFGRDQIEQVIGKLAGDINSTRAVMSLWDVKDYEGNDSPPCLNHIWLEHQKGKLSLTATFRSNDMFTAWPANAMGLRALQQHICTEINQKSNLQIKLGPLIIISQSAHIYDDTWEHADLIIEREYVKICKEREYADPSGSFAVTIELGTIVVDHLTPGSGEIVHRYSGKSARKLYQQIAADCPGLEVEHALYLGTELQKAEIALFHEGDGVYQQDKPFLVSRRGAEAQRGRLG